MLLFGSLDGRSHGLLAAQGVAEGEQYGARRTSIDIGKHKGFVLEPAKPAANGARPWVWYAPTIGSHPNKSNEWVLRKLLERGFHVCGVNVGESFGSPSGRRAFTEFHEHVVRAYRLDAKASLLAQSRGGLMLYNWAAENPDKVRCIAGIYPVCDLRSYPGLNRAAGAYGLTPQELEAQLAWHNPIDRLEPLAKARVPILHLHGDADAIVPLEKNSQVLAERYAALGGKMTLLVVPGKGHAEIAEYFQDPRLVQFLSDGEIAELIPGLMKREVSPEGVVYLQQLLKRTPFGTSDFNLTALRAGMGTRREPTIKNVKLIKVSIGDVPGEWVLAPGADPDVRLLYLHGGGFVSGTGGYYLRQAAHISAAARCAILLPDYRLAPEYPFPAGLDDCVAAHQWMIANGPTGASPARATFIAGDSAGGGLTLSTLLALRDRKMSLPAGGIPISPCTDFTLASASLKTVHDPIISARTMPVFRDHYLGKADPRDPLASPVFGDYRGLPPLLIQIGEHEMLRDDGIRAARKARADGIEVILQVWPGMFHVFHSHEPLLPEARAAIEHIGEFVRSSLPRK